MSDDELQRERAYVGMLYGRLDDLRERTAVRLSRTLAEPGASAQARVEREVSAAALTERVARLEAAENGLCFGRLDLREGGRRYIGRINVMDDSDEGDPLLLDWRAPAARPFYVATAAAPEGVRRRRHITTRRRQVIGLDDEMLDGGGLADPDGLVGEAALLAALNTGRTGRMGDIVATLQAEQDEIIRSDHRGVLVVQGGPGTGKTAVALHRAAYLLYTHQRLAARGVLVVGPNAAFLSYIGQVLPGLGETSVLLSTVGGLFPGVTPDRDEPAETAELKGRAVMARVVATAVADRQGVLSEPLDVRVGEETVRLEPGVCARAAERARAGRLPHNQARRLFATEIIAVLAEEAADLTRRLADRLEDELAQMLDESEMAALRAMPDDSALPGFVDPEATRPDPIAGAQEVAALRRELRDEPGVHAALDRLWPELTPRRLLEELFADPARLDTAAGGLTLAERRSLLRRPGGWSVADVPLLDEAAELLGEDDHRRAAVAERRRAERVAYAQGVLDIGTGSRSSDLDDGEAADLLTAADLLDAHALADRHETADHRTVAERAAADRSWTFGHVIVDEAQELSEMAWRLLMRRCPTRSMTVVGDTAQTGDAAGTSSWRRVLEPLVGDRWRLTRLSVNYRTPAEVMEVAAGVLSALDPEMPPPRSVRESGVAPWHLPTAPGDLPAALAGCAVREAAALGAEPEGTLAVIVPDARLGELGAAVRAVLPEASFGSRPDLRGRVVVLGVRQAKGLEFDSVLLADPAAVLTGSARGLNDLYVALTRATKRLGVLHPGPLPSVVTGMIRRT